MSDQCRHAKLTWDHNYSVAYCDGCGSRFVAREISEDSPQSEAVEPSTATELAMRDAPTIYEVVMRAMRDHYWDSLEPQKDLVLKHIEGAMRPFAPLEKP